MGGCATCRAGVIVDWIEPWWSIEVAKIPPLNIDHLHSCESLSFSEFIEYWEHYKSSIEAVLCVNYINRLDEQSLTMLRLCCLGALYYLAKRALAVGVWTPAIYEIRYQEFINNADQETKDIGIRLNGAKWKEVFNSSK